MSKKEFVDEMIRVSYIRFYNFVKLFNLDPTLFNHLSNIRFIFKKMISYGSYNPSENIITINEKIMNAAYNLKINNKLTDEIIEMITTTIIHEILHANRTVLIKNKYTSGILEDVINFKKKKRKSEDFDNYYKTLEDIKKTIGFDKFNRYIPVTVTTKSKGAYEVIANDKMEEKYCYFRRVRTSISFYENNHFLEDISKKLDTISNYEVLQENLEDITFPTTIDAYILDDDIENKMKKDKDLTYKISDRQESLEEAFIETLSKLIAKCPNKSNFYQKLDEISRDEDTPEDAQVACRIIEIGGMDFVKWFLLSVYQDEYVDEFKQLFSNNYQSFLEYLNNIKNASYSFKDASLDDLLAVDQIFDDTKKRVR